MGWRTQLASAWEGTPTHAEFSVVRAFESIDSLVKRYATNPLFGNTGALIVEDNPYIRPVRPQDIPICSFGTPLDVADISSTSALAAQRMLLNIYECDAVFLPQGSYTDCVVDFRLFYSEENRQLGALIRPALERHVFAFLEREIDVSGSWSLAGMRAYFDAQLSADAKSESIVGKAILSASNPEAAAATFLIQLAGDFLTEASAMARNVLGNFGATQSELFKVLIDEYGYGIHETKHSTLFEETLKSRGLSPKVHAYWQFYLVTSIALTNYFHFVSKCHEHFFRYLGALYYTEAALVAVTKGQSRMLRQVWGSSVDTRYFDEHTHIDRHHARMVIEKIITPIVEQLGDAVIPQIVRGFEEYRTLQELADQDLASQIAWCDRREDYKALAARVAAGMSTAALSDGEAEFTEPAGELSVMHVHDVDELLTVEEGELEIVAGYLQSVTLGAGEGVVIPRNRHHGSIVSSATCRYRVRPMDNEKLCSS